MNRLPHITVLFAADLLVAVFVGCGGTGQKTEATKKTVESKSSTKIIIASDQINAPKDGDSENSRPSLVRPPFNAKAANEYQEQWAKYLGSKKVITNSIGMKLRLIPAGKFKQEITEDFVRIVGIYRPFYLGETEVTVGQFRQFVKDTKYLTDSERDGEGGSGWDEEKGTFLKAPEYSWRNPGFKQTDDYPVVNVSWNDAVAFCRWLNRKENMAYRLPTSIEWEYACRAGTTTKYYSGNDLENVALIANTGDASLDRIYKESGRRAPWDDGYAFSSPVGRFKENNFGLFDMHGNVSEWYDTYYDETHYGKSPTDYPSGPFSMANQSFMGTKWEFPPGDSPFDGYSVPENRRRYNIGFRVARTAKRPAPSKEQIHQWVMQLGDEHIKVREKAERNLIDAGRIVFTLLTKANLYDDSKVRQQVLKLLEKAALSYFQALGGRVVFDENSPGKPAIALSLKGTVITNSGLVYLKGLPNLKDLVLQSTRISDVGLLEVKGHSNIQNLFLFQTQITDAGLVHLKELPNLRELSLGRTLVSNKGLVHLKGHVNLKTLDLWHTNVSDAGLVHLKGLANLQRLGLWRTKITDSGLNELKGLSSLQEINLGMTRISNSGLVHLKGFSNLKKLNLGATRVTDSGLIHLEGLTNLRFLGFKDAKVTQAGIDKLQKALPKCEIEFPAVLELLELPFPEDFFNGGL